MGPRDLDRLSGELVRLCDSVEKHGLVDYQMGVAEEDIMDREFCSSHIRYIHSDHASSAATVPRVIESPAGQKR